MTPTTAVTAEPGRTSTRTRTMKAVVKAAAAPGAPPPQGPSTRPPPPAVTAEPGRTSTRTRTMKAVVKAAAAPGAEIRDVPVPTAGAGEVLLRVLRAGVCGTDLHIWTWDRW